MVMHVALNHRTTYRYDRPVALGPQVVRLRPAPHCRTRVVELFAEGRPGRALHQLAAGPVRQLAGAARLPRADDRVAIEVDLVAEMAVLNPFDFFVEPLRRDVPVRLRADCCAGARALPRAPEPAGAAARSASLADDRRARPRAPSTSWSALNQRLQQRRSATSSAWSRACRRRRRRWSAAAARAATPAGCWCRSCATSASPRASSRAT